MTIGPLWMFKGPTGLFVTEDPFPQLSAEFALLTGQATAISKHPKNIIITGFLVEKGPLFFAKRDDKQTCRGGGGGGGISPYKQSSIQKQYTK